MKKILPIILLFLLSLAFFSSAQNIPQGFKYQTAIRDNTGALLSNKLVALRLSFLRASATGTVIYVETHNLNTNDFGIANLNIGTGTPLQGNFETIDWSNGPYFLKTELDVNNGSNFLFMGTNQLLSVPFALYAAKSANAENDFDKDSLNEIQQLSLNSNQLQLSKNGGSIILSKYIDNTDSQTLSLSDRKLIISNGNFVNLNDNDSLNEIQNISLAGDQLQLSKNGGSINLSKYTDNTDSQTLILQGTNLSISRGNSITLSGVVDLDSDPTNEIQTLSINKDSIRLSQANYIILPKDNDLDSTNEIQTLLVTGNKLIISKSNQVNIDGDTSNEIQSLSFVNDSLRLSKSNRVFMPGVPVGTIVAFGGRNIPPGWLLCDGSLVNRSQFPNLFLILDSVWGSGNSTTTFNLPDLRGQFLRGVSGTSNVDPDTTMRTPKYSGGNTGNNVGSYQVDELKSHSHLITRRTNSSNGNYFAAGSNAASNAGPDSTLDTGGTETRPKNAYVYYIIKY
jgi:microcystin-dependent protein